MRKYLFVAGAILLLAFAMVFASRAQGPRSGGLLSEFRPIGGVRNNLLHPIFNAIPGSAELAIAPLRFANPATMEPVGAPNPRSVSNIIAGGASTKGDDTQSTNTVASAWLTVFGQFVDHDLSLESSVSQGGVTKHPRMRTIINTTAGYLDLSQLYGSTPEMAASLRDRDGPLKSARDGQSLQIIDGRFVAADPRVNDNPELAMITMLFMREHNHWVGELKRQHPDWTGRQYYEMARAITTAEYQNIIYTEFLPVLIGPALGPYLGYDPRVNAQVTQEFSTAAFRIGHTQASDTQSVDLIAIDIQRGRDVGLATLNQTRKALGLAPHASFAALTSDKALQAQFQALYRDIDQVDLFTGGQAEAHLPGAMVGETFQVIIARQFHALRVGDRFFWANQGFDSDTADRIAQTTLSQVIKRNTDSLRVPLNVFVAEGDGKTFTFP